MASSGRVLTPLTDSCWVIEKTDLWGDGWGGAEYTLTNLNGQVAASGTLESGAYEADQVCGLPNDCYTMSVFSAGQSWMNAEIQWKISQGGVVLAEGGAASTVSVCMDGAPSMPPTVPPTRLPTISLQPTQERSDEEIALHALYEGTLGLQFLHLLYSHQWPLNLNCSSLNLYTCTQLKW